MMIKRQIIRVAMGLLLAGGSAVAAADPTNGWYFGISGGQSSADLGRADQDAAIADALADQGLPLTSIDSTEEDNDFSWSLFGGYRFSPYFALEGAYVDFGTYEYNASAFINPPGPVSQLPADFGAEVSIDGFTFSAVGSIPLSQTFELHGQLGTLIANTEITERATIATSSVSDSQSATSQEFFYGVGVGLHVSPQWSVSLDWQQFKDVGDDDDTGEEDIDRLSLSVIYRL